MAQAQPPSWCNRVTFSSLVPLGIVGTATFRTRIIVKRAWPIRYRTILTRFSASFRARQRNRWHPRACCPTASFSPFTVPAGGSWRWRCQLARCCQWTRGTGVRQSHREHDHKNGRVESTVGDCSHIRDRIFNGTAMSVGCFLERMGALLSWYF